MPCLFSEVIIVLEALKVSPWTKHSGVAVEHQTERGHYSYTNTTVQLAIQELKKGNLIERTRLWNIIVFYILTCVYCDRNKANTVQICVGFLCLVSCVQQRSFCQKRWDLSLVVLGTGKWVMTWGFWFGWHHWWVASLFLLLLLPCNKPKRGLI